MSHLAIAYIVMIFVFFTAFVLAKRWRIFERSKVREELGDDYLPSAVVFSILWIPFMICVALMMIWKFIERVATPPPPDENRPGTFRKAKDYIIGKIYE